MNIIIMKINIFYNTLIYKPSKNYIYLYCFSYCYSLFYCLFFYFRVESWTRDKKIKIHYF